MKLNNFSNNKLSVPDIHFKASEVTNLTVRNGELCLHGKPVSTTPARIAMDEFLQFLRRIGKKIVLVAHNGFTFDAPVLTAEVKKLGMWSLFSEIVEGFADSLPLFKATLKDRVKEKKSFKLTELANDYLPVAALVGEAHNAIADVHMLQALLGKLNVTKEDISTSVRSVNFVAYQSDLKARVNLRVEKLSSVLKDKVSNGMMKKIATAGISLEALQEAYQSNKDSGIANLLSESVAGKPRVTKSKVIIDKVTNALSL